MRIGLGCADALRTVVADYVDAGDERDPMQAWVGQLQARFAVVDGRITPPTVL
jgi:hypothetical protein